MSAKKHHKTPLGRAADAFSLALVFGILYAATRLVPQFHGDTAVLAGLGFLLLSGTLMSELVEVLGVPHLTGYLLAGVLAGPHVFHLIDHETVTKLGPVNTLAIALIALAGGAELRLSTLREGLRSLLTAQLIQTVFGLLLMTGAFILIRPGFTQNMTFTALVGVALLWGVFATTRSPAALLAVLSQTRASGPLARFALSFVMSSDLIVVVVLALVITIARPLVDPSATLSFAAFGDLGHELIGSIAMGTTLGLVLAAYLKLSGRQLLVVLIALGFGATEVLHYLSLEPILTFLVAGFVVQNLSKEGDKFLHAIEETGGVVYVVFFAAAGAHLNVPLLKEFWPVALLLTGSRIAVTFVLARFSSRLAKDEPTVRTWGWVPLISQAGVALGIAQVVARQFPTFGSSFRDVGLACIAVNEVVGPVLFKFALDRANETSAPSPSLSDTEEAA